MPFPAELAARIDLHLWKPGATLQDFENLCTFARQNNIRAICVPGSRVVLASARLEETAIKTVALVGFPLGSSDGDVKRFETETAIDHGAQEIEFVLNPSLLKEGQTQTILREMRDIAEAADERPVCVVLETNLLTRDEIVRACHLALDSGVTAISTASGFLPPSREPVAEVALLREAVGPAFLVKCADLSYPAALPALLQAGASRIGTSHFELLNSPPDL